MIAIDTNVFVYSIDSADPAKQLKARALIRDTMTSGQATVVPWQVAVEFLAKLRQWQQAGKISADDAKIRFDEFLAIWVLAFPTARVLHAALRLHDRYSLSHWDSLLVAACAEAGVSQLYSEDMQHGADYDGVIIVDPFA